MVGGKAWGGYQKIKREYNDRNKIAREVLLDTEGNPVNTAEGYASREPVYDDYDNITGYKYYDISGNEVISKQ